ncbi:MAG: acyltransferase family protein [Dermatophilaceae bacterium]
MTAVADPTRRAEPSTRPAPRPASRRDSRLPGLDGLRALAIVAVLVFHLNPGWLPGGYLGVDIFFVVSGFLITTLLVRERADTGRVDLPAFWARRARRLLPALLICVPVSVVLARLVQADLLVGIGRQILGALTFSTNWLEIGAGSDYFHATTPQLFMNLWSLAVEEQFYLVWPLVTVGLLTAVRSARARALIALGAGLTSTIAMAVRFEPGAGTTRVYYGTDTHLMGLMFGAALAFAYAGPDRSFFSSERWARLRHPVTVSALAVLGALLWFADEASSWTFRGGLAAACLATTILVAVAVSTPGTFQRVLQLPVLRWIGERSYAIYLWHWPVILVVSQDMHTTPGGPGFLPSRVFAVVVTLALADLSLRFVEMPVRRLGWRGAFRRLLRLPSLGRFTPLQWLAGIIALVVLVIGGIVLTAPESTSTQRRIDANAAAASAGSSRTTTTTPGTVKQSWGMPSGKALDIYGDSMTVGSVPALQYYFPGVRIDARSNRLWKDGLAAVEASGTNIRRAVILDFGTNGGVDETALRETLRLLGPQRMVVLVNLHVNMARTATDNAILAEVASENANVIVADWNSAVTAESGQLQPDGIHPSMTGQHLYAKVIRQALADLSERHTGRSITLKPLPIP